MVRSIDGPEDGAYPSHSQPRCAEEEKLLNLRRVTVGVRIGVP